MKLADYLTKLDSKKPIQLKEIDEDYVKKVWIQINKSEVADWRVTDKEVNRQLVAYLARSASFKGDLSKGILLIGENGTGKSRMLKALSLAMGYLHNFRFAIHSGLEIEDIYKRGGDRMNSLEMAMAQKMFGFDDIGEEHDYIKVFGTDVNVGIDVISRRYNHQMNVGCLTFGTTNLSLEMQAQKYGARIESRMHEMFNVVYLRGKDLRKTK